MATAKPVTSPSPHPAPPVQSSAPTSMKLPESLLPPNSVCFTSSATLLTCPLLSISPATTRIQATISAYVDDCSGCFPRGRTFTSAVSSIVHMAGRERASQNGIVMTGEAPPTWLLAGGFSSSPPGLLGCSGNTKHGSWLPPERVI